MSMSLWACNDWAITPKKMKEFLPEEWNAFEVALKGIGLSFDELCIEIGSELLQLNEYDPCIASALSNLQAAFKKKTTTKRSSLQISYLGFVSSEESEPDGVEGGYFSIGNVTKITPAGANMLKKNIVTLASWVASG